MNSGMIGNPYQSPRQIDLPSARENTKPVRARDGIIWGVARGAIFGAVIAGIPVVLVLLYLGLWVRTPMLTQSGLLIVIKIAGIMIAAAVIPSAAIGAVGFGVREWASQGRPAKSANGQQPHGPASQDQPPADG
jgi:hypothetical protein